MAPVFSMFSEGCVLELCIVLEASMAEPRIQLKFFLESMLHTDREESVQGCWSVAPNVEIGWKCLDGLGQSPGIHSDARSFETWFP